MANWLNSTFYSFDNSVFNFMNNFALKAGGFFTPFFKVVSFFGESGIFFIALSLVFILFKKTRRFGFGMLLAVGVGALFTNVIIKNAVARPRPFTRDEYKGFWLLVSGKEQSEYSFPSGHTTVTTTSMTFMFLHCNKKWSWVGFIAVFLMAFSRVYLIVHYTTDVIGGMIVGGTAGTIAYFLNKLIYKYLEKYGYKKFCHFALNADIIDLFKKEKSQDGNNDEQDDKKE